MKVLGSGDEISLGVDPATWAAGRGCQSSGNDSNRVKSCCLWLPDDDDEDEDDDEDDDDEPYKTYKKKLVFLTIVSCRTRQSTILVDTRLHQ